MRYKQACRGGAQVVQPPCYNYENFWVGSALLDQIIVRLKKYLTMP